MKKNNTIIGQFEWADLTVGNATDLRDFYSGVVGFTHSEVDMGGYQDFCMVSPSDEKTKAGICHARGMNKNIPPLWMIYFNVEDLDQSISEVEERGGTVIDGPKGNTETGRYCFIQDPAGAYCALFQKPGELEE